MIRTLIIVLFVLPLTVFSQEKVEVKRVIQTMFEGMHEKDTAKVRSVFAKEVLLQTIPEDRPSGAVIETGDLEKFIGGLASIPPHIKIEERLWNYDINVDGHLATAWTEYTFLINDEISHCGANAFQLFKDASGWKITKIIDTRSQSNCRTEPDAVMKIAELLDNWHKAAAEADEDTFFGQYDPRCHLSGHR